MIFQIRGMSISDALTQVKFCEKKASKFVETVCFHIIVIFHIFNALFLIQTLLDAQRRAEQTFDLDPLNLHVSKKDLASCSKILLSLPTPLYQLNRMLGKAPT